MNTERISIYKGPINLKDIASRTVRLKIKHDEGKKVFAELVEVDPNMEHNCRTVGDEIVFTVPRRLKNGRTRATRFSVDFYQYAGRKQAEKVVQTSQVPDTQSFNLMGLNPKIEDSQETNKGATGRLSSVISQRLSQGAITKAEKRKAELKKKRDDYAEAKALKPVGMDGRKVLTCDDVGYTKAAGIIKYLVSLEEKHNEGVPEAEKRLINEFYDCFAFSGTTSIIGLYLSLGKKSIGRGSIEYLLKWWTNNFRYAFSMTPGQNAKAKISRIFKGRKPEGLSEVNVRRLLEGLFINPNSQEQFKLADINMEVYQPLMFDDLRTRVYTKGGTPDITLVEVAMSCGIDPKLFHIQQTEDIGSSIGAFRRSFDLPLAQYNEDISITSLGVPLRYQPPKKSNASATQMSAISKEAGYKTEYHDTLKYMSEHRHKVRFMRIETKPMDGFSRYSVNRDNLRYAIACGHKAQAILMDQKLLER